MFRELFTEAGKAFSEVSKGSITAVQKLFAKNGAVTIMTASGKEVIIDEIEKNIGYGMDSTDNEVEVNLTKDKYSIVESSDIQNIAAAIKGKSLFDMDKPLKKAGFKTTSMGYSAIKVTKGSSSWYIASEKNAEAGSDDIVQDGYVIGRT